MRLIEEKSEKGYTYKIYHDAMNAEFQVKHYFQNVLIQGMEYYTGDREDAVKTARIEHLKLLIVEMERGA